MTSRTHDMIGFAGLLTVVSSYPPSTLSVSTVFACLIGNVVGSLIPDMDQATNQLWDLLPAGNLVGRIFRRLMISHRTLSHSLLGIFLLKTCMSLIIPKLLNPAFIEVQLVIWSVCIGFTAHIAADMFTKEGVPLLFPIKWNIGMPPFAFFRITTGKFTEKFFIFPGSIAYIIWLVVTRHAEFLTLFRLIRS
jgi:inner membrane protein